MPHENKTYKYIEWLVGSSDIQFGWIQNRINSIFNIGSAIEATLISMGITFPLVFFSDLYDKKFLFDNNTLNFWTIFASIALLWFILVKLVMPFFKRSFFGRDLSFYSNKAITGEFHHIIINKVLLVLEIKNHLNDQQASPISKQILFSEILEDCIYIMNFINVNVLTIKKEMIRTSYKNSINLQTIVNGISPHLILYVVNAITDVMSKLDENIECIGDEERRAICCDIAAVKGAITTANGILREHNKSIIISN